MHENWIKQIQSSVGRLGPPPAMLLWEFCVKRLLEKLAKELSNGGGGNFNHFYIAVRSLFFGGSNFACGDLKLTWF